MRIHVQIKWTSKPSTFEAGLRSLKEVLRFISTIFAMQVHAL